MELASQNAWLVVAAVSLLAAVVAVSLAILAIGTLRRGARRVTDQVRELRRHVLVGDLASENEPALRALTLEINHVLQDLRSRLQEARGRSGDLQALVDGPLDIALIGTDPEWRVISFSQGATAMTRWTREEILDRHVEILFAPGEWERILPKLARRSLREAGIAETVRLQPRDGGAFPARLSLGVAAPEADSTGGALLAARDLTAELALETKLREAEDRYRRLVEGLSDGVFIVKDDCIVYANPALERVVGVARERLQGRPFADLLHSRDLLKVVEVLRRAGRAEGGLSGEFSTGLLNRAGAPREARISWAVTEFRGGPAVVGTVVDLTERIRLEQEVASSEARLRSILQSTGDGILVLGTAGQGSMRLANRAFCDLFGLPEETIARLSEEELRPALLERCKAPEALGAFLAAAPRSSAETRLEGLEITQPRRALCDLVAGPVLTPAGEVLGLILTVRDVTGRVEMERNLRTSIDDLSTAKSQLETAYRELAEAQKTLAQRNVQLETLNAELKSLDEMKSALLANVSHELHTQLVSIKGYTEMILKRRLGPLTPEQERGLGVALKNIDRLVEMIDNLLSFSRMEQGETQLQLEDFPLWQLIDESIEMVGERIKKKNISLTTQYESDDLMARADRVKIGQVLANLLTNAIKFNREGGRITLTSRRGPRGFLEVEVADTGIGIPPEEHERIFERFYQVDSSPSKRYEGTGIGLSIVRDILRLHGCSIRVRSEAGQGSVFTFTLPQAADRPSSQARRALDRARTNP